jgi:hypothetical protein
MAMPGKYYHFFVDKIPSERTKPPWLRREFPSAMFEDTGGYAPSVFQHFPLEGILFGIVAKWMRA